MLFNIEDSNVNSLFYKALKDHKLHGMKQFIRGTTRHEITNYMMRLTEPKQNMLFVPFRYMNPPAIIAETLWVLAGRYDLWFLGYYLKNSYKYSDDGGDTWRGAYSKRLRNYSAHDDEGKTIIIDQIDRAITYLKKDLQTTRSLLVIPDGSDYHLDEEGNEKKDEPCTIFVQFIHREGDLCCSVNMRSNDLVLGCFNVNVFEWTFLQTLIANELFSSMGHYTVSATSMHVYTDWMKRLPILLDNEPAVDIYSIVPAKQLTITWSTFKHEVQRLLQVEQNLRITHASRISDYVLSLQGEFHEDIYDALLAMMISLAAKLGAHGSLCELLPEMRNDIWLVACLEYMVRRLGNSFHSLVHKIFNETLGERYDQMTVKYLHNYIMHSLYEKEAITRLK